MAAATCDPVRCLCNKLLCTRSGNIIEIKCNKCKRILRIETAGIIRMTYLQEEVSRTLTEGQPARL